MGLDGTAQWTRVLLKFELRDDVLSLAASEEIAGDPPADPTPASGSGTIPEESPEKRFERLRLRIVKKRRQQVIEQMERKLAGEKPAFRAEIPDFTLAHGQKRPASPSAEEPFQKRPTDRPKAPSIFSGKDIAELDTFEVSFRAYFDATGVTNITRKIQLAATYLTDNP